MAERTSLALALGVAIASAMPLAGCYTAEAPYGAPCEADPDCPSHQTCDPQTKTCGPESVGDVWRDDTASDFDTAGAAIDEATIEAGGFIAPIAYFGGGLRLSGVGRNVIPNASTPWNELAAVTRTGGNFLRGAELNVADVPFGLGLTKADDIAIIVEGEIYLDEIGTWTFELTANDIGFVELAPPGSSAFVRVVTDANNKTEGTYEVAQRGWHRLRGAVGDASGGLVYELRYRAPGQAGGGRTIPAGDLRGPAGDLTGVIVDGFEDPFLIGPRGVVVDSAPLGGVMLASDPFGLTVGNSSYSLRFAGQVRIDVDGDYDLRIDTSQGHRVWLDGVSIADKLDDMPQVTMTGARQLEPGWHDLVVDVNRVNAASAQLDVKVASGPAWAGQTIPLDHLRPVVGRATRWAGGLSTTTQTIPDGGTVTKTVSFEVPPGMVANQIDTWFTISHPVLATMEVRLTPPNGGTATLLAANTLTTGGSYSKHGMMPPSTGGPTWSFLARDTDAADLKTGNISYAAVTMIGSGGPEPFPASYRYVSAPRELGDVAGFAYVKWGLRQASPDTKVAVSLRTCDTAAACDGEPWTAAEYGFAPQVKPRRFAQYMVALTGKGDVPTALDWIEIGYRTFGN